ncbi:YecA family protein [Oribacterium sp. HCP3S3_B9]|uniref:YecA family protein n=1 Tax=Oribacterium sp. HCP3S3_B9 TaxID=3438946 RepID=UPI003F89EBCD
MERLYGGKLDRDETIKAAEGKVDYIDSNLDEFEALSYAPGYFTPTIYEDGEEYEKYKAQGDKLHISEREVELLIKDQGPRPFYIPNRSEIEELSETGMIANSYYKKLKKKVPGIKEIWDGFYSGEEMKEVIEKAIAGITSERHDGMPIVDMDVYMAIAGMIGECYNHTNLRENRGWEPIKLQEALGGFRMPNSIAPMSSQMAEMMREAESDINAMGVKVDYESGFGSFTTTENGKVKKIKVGRNDPCPCGSGKKYKKCHGRADIGTNIGAKTDATEKDRNKEKKEDKMMNKKEKPWDSFVLFAPEKMMEQVTEDYYFYGTDESIILSKERLNDNPPEIVKCVVNRSEDGPNQIAVYDDQLFAMSKHFPGMLDEVDGLSAFIGIIADAKTIVIHIA